MELSQGEIIQKCKSLLVHDISSYCDVCTCEVSRIYSIRFWSYGPDTKVGRMDGQTDGRTDGRTDRRTGRTGVTRNALPLFFE